MSLPLYWRPLTIYSLTATGCDVLRQPGWGQHFFCPLHYVGKNGPERVQIFWEPGSTAVIWAYRTNIYRYSKVGGPKFFLPILKDSFRWKKFQHYRPTNQFGLPLCSFGAFQKVKSAQNEPKMWDFAKMCPKVILTSTWHLLHHIWEMLEI